MFVAVHELDGFIRYATHIPGLALIIKKQKEIWGESMGMLV